MITNNAQFVESRFSDSVSINRGMFSSISFPSIIFLVAANIKVVLSPWFYRLPTRSLIEIKRRWTNQHAERSWNSARRTTGDEKDCRIGDKTYRAWKTEASEDILFLMRYLNGWIEKPRILKEDSRTQLSFSRPCLYKEKRWNIKEERACVKNAVGQLTHEKSSPLATRYRPNSFCLCLVPIVFVIILIVDAVFFHHLTSLITSLISLLKDELASIPVN